MSSTEYTLSGCTNPPRFTGTFSKVFAVIMEKETKTTTTLPRLLALSCLSILFKTLNKYECATPAPVTAACLSPGVMGLSECTAS